MSRIKRAWSRSESRAKPWTPLKVADPDRELELYAEDALVRLGEGSDLRPLEEG
jgi:hypothetical protein